METTCKPWKCTRCAAVVFIPEGAGITGGVCTQKARGCGGELAEMGEAEAAGVRLIMATRRIAEQPWLTLIFAAPAAEVPHG